MTKSDSADQDMSDSPSVLTEDQLRKMQAQLGKWRKDLLVLDRRQRLLYFKHTRTASLEIGSTTPQGLLQLLERSEPTVEPEFRDQQESTGDDSQVFVRRTLPSSGVSRVLVSNKTESDLPAALRRLDQHSNQVYADRGIWTLYLGLGLLQWIDPEDNRTVESPVLLVPVRLHREGTKSPYQLSRTEDEVVVNPALRLKMEQDFDLELPDVDPYAIDVDKLLAELESRIRDHDQWAIHPRTVLTSFSFHKEAIYRDLLDHESQIVSHPMVQLVALGPDAPSAAGFGFDPVPDAQLDEVTAPEKLHSILDADGSQRKCILAARDDRSFVMDGPPGTGIRLGRLGGGWGHDRFELGRGQPAERVLSAAPMVGAFDPARRTG